MGETLVIKEIEKGLEAFSKLGIQEQKTWLIRFQEAHSETVEARKRELEAELRELDAVEPLVPANPSKGRKVKPKYRSKKDPSLTWAGRGEQPKWLREEMEASGKPLEYYLIKQQ